MFLAGHSWLRLGLKFPAVVSLRSSCHKTHDLSALNWSSPGAGGAALNFSAAHDSSEKNFSLTRARLTLAGQLLDFELLAIEV